jgi:hypothetical protein
MGSASDSWSPSQSEHAVLTPGQPRRCVPAGQQLPLELVQRGHWNIWPAPPQPLHSSAVDRTPWGLAPNLTLVLNFNPPEIAAPVHTCALAPANDNTIAVTDKFHDFARRDASPRIHGGVLCLLVVQKKSV